MVDALRADLVAREEELLAFIARLVDVSSFTENAEGGNRVGAMLVEAMEAAGLEVKREPSTRFAHHLVATTRAASASAEGAVVIVGHHDTVFPAGTFEGFRRDGELARGPGVLDMKGGLAMAIGALAALHRAGRLDEMKVRFVIVGDEEVGSPEGRGVIERACEGAACALVLEAGRAHDKIITARKGTGSVRAIATGKAAHAGNAHAEGRNAIWALARFVDRAQQITDYARGVTVNVGTIRGGQSKNTVPDEAEAALDFRFERVADADATRAAFEAAALAAAESLPGTTVRIEQGSGRLPLERNAANVALFREYGACAKAAGLGCEESGLLGGGSDASTTQAMGIASIDGMGPRGAGFHTKEERIEVASLTPKAEAIIRFLMGRFR
jgi:glutamate carboxypeptidase